MATKQYGLFYHAGIVDEWITLPSLEDPVKSMMTYTFPSGSKSICNINKIYTYMNILLRKTSPYSLSDPFLQTATDPSILYIMILSAAKSVFFFSP